VALCSPEKADEDITNANELSGKMAVVYREQAWIEQLKGFHLREKTERLIAAGAQGVVIVNHDDTLPEHFGEDTLCALSGFQTTVPVVMIRAKDAEPLLAMGNSSCLSAKSRIRALALEDCHERRLITGTGAAALESKDPFSGETPLLTQVQLGDLENAKRLLQAGANANAFTTATATDLVGRPPAGVGHPRSKPTSPSSRRVETGAAADSQLAASPVDVDACSMCV